MTYSDCTDGQVKLNPIILSARQDITKSVSQNKTNQYKESETCWRDSNKNIMSDMLLMAWYTGECLSCQGVIMALMVLFCAQCDPD